MVSPETRVHGPEGNTDRIHRSVRVFAVAPIPVEQLAELLAEGKSPDEISFVEVVLAQKADTTRVTAIGGEINPGESLLDAGMRKAFEKTLVTRESLRNLQNSGGHEIPIRYRVNGEQRLCEAFLIVMPVRSKTVSLHQPREDAQYDTVYKIKRLVSVTPRELAQLFSEGSVTTRQGEKYRIFGHLTESASNDVVVLPEDRDVQHQEFSRVLDEIHRYEDGLKQEMIFHINRVRRWHHQPGVTSLGNCSRDELKESLLAAQMNMGLSDEKQRDRENGKKPARPADLLNTLIYLSEFERDKFINSLISVPTAEVRRVRNILKYALRGTVTKLYDEMHRDVTEFSSNGSRDGAYLDTIKALKAVWPDVISLPLAERTQLIGQLNDRFVTELSRRLGKSPEVLHRAFTMPRAIAKHIAEELPGEQFQQHHPINEVANAKPFTLLLFTLGLHPNRNDMLVRDIVRDSLMAWSHIMTSIPVIERHMLADNSVLEGALDTFFGSPIPEEIILENPDVPHKIYHRKTCMKIGDRELHIITDERPLKTDERATVKAYVAADVYDDFAINLVIADDNYPDGPIDISARLKTVRELRDAFMKHVLGELRPSGWDAGIAEGTHKTEVLQALKAYEHLETDAERREFVEKRTNGSRAGSFGNVILREKFIVWYSQPDGKHYCEISIYPFESTAGTSLDGSGWVPFDKKLTNDMSGGYLGARLEQTDSGDPTGPALVELLEPPSWSPVRFQPVRKHQHTPKMK
jgi:biopolymer transport protein ExbD